MNKFHERIRLRGQPWPLASGRAVTDRPARWVRTWKRENAGAGSDPRSRLWVGGRVPCSAPQRQLPPRTGQRVLAVMVTAALLFCSRSKQGGCVCERQRETGRQRDTCIPRTWCRFWKETWQEIKATEKDLSWVSNTISVLFRQRHMIHERGH